MPFGSLWLPVVVSAVAVFVVSAILHMVLKYHRADYKRLPDEEAVGAALRKDSPAPGLYVIPWCTDAAAMKDPAMQERYRRGPVGLVTLMKTGPPAMGKHLLLWFLFCLLVSFSVAYVLRHALAATDPALLALRIAGVVAFVGYGYGNFQASIWHGQPWSNTVRALIDSVIDALVTAAIFWWLWPTA